MSDKIKRWVADRLILLSYKICRNPNIALRVKKIQMHDYINKYQKAKETSDKNIHKSKVRYK